VIHASLFFCFSPVDRDLGFATRGQAWLKAGHEWFQSRRPGFRLCDAHPAGILEQSWHVSVP